MFGTGQAFRHAHGNSRVRLRTFPSLQRALENRQRRPHFKISHDCQLAGLRAEIIAIKLHHLLMRQRVEALNRFLHRRHITHIILSVGRQRPREQPRHEVGPQKSTSDEQRPAEQPLRDHRRPGAVDLVGLEHRRPSEGVAVQPGCHHAVQIGRQPADIEGVADIGFGVEVHLDLVKLQFLDKRRQLDRVQVNARQEQVETQGEQHLGEADHRHLAGRARGERPGQE